MPDPMITTRPLVISPAGGRVRSVLGRRPLAGAELSEQVGGGVVWQLLGLQATFVASATAATRTVSLRLTDGANVFYTAPAGTTVLASETATLVASTAGFNPASSLTNNLIPLPLLCLLAETMVINTLTANIAVGDQFSAITLWVIEWGIEEFVKKVRTV